MQPTLSEWSFNIWDVTLYKVGRNILFTVNTSGTMPATSDFVTLITLPEGYRPIGNIIVNYATQEGKIMCATIKPNGQFQLYNFGTAVNGWICRQAFTYLSA